MNSNYINYGEIENYKRKFIIIITLSNILSFLSGFLINNKINTIYIYTNSTL